MHFQPHHISNLQWLVEIKAAMQELARVAALKWNPEGELLV